MSLNPGAPYAHDVVFGEDGIARCRVCRAASYSLSTIAGIPCSDKAPAPTQAPDGVTIEYGVEPSSPMLGTFWMNPRLLTTPGTPSLTTAGSRLMVWAEHEGGQDWVDAATGKPMTEPHQLRLPNSQYHPATKIHNRSLAISDEMLHLMSDHNFHRTVDDHIRSLYRDAANAGSLVVGGTKVALLVDRPTQTWLLTATAVTRAIPLTMKNTIKIGLREPPESVVHGVNRSSI